MAKCRTVITFGAFDGEEQNCHGFRSYLQGAFIVGHSAGSCLKSGWGALEHGACIERAQLMSILRTLQSMYNTGPSVHVQPCVVFELHTAHRRRKRKGRRKGRERRVCCFQKLVGTDVFLNSQPQSLTNPRGWCNLCRADAWRRFQTRLMETASQSSSIKQLRTCTVKAQNCHASEVARPTSLSLKAETDCVAWVLQLRDSEVTCAIMAPVA